MSAVADKKSCFVTTSMAVNSNTADLCALKEQNYFGLSDCSSVDSSPITLSDDSSLNLKETELRLGLPGSRSPKSDHAPGEVDVKPLFPLYPSKDGVSTICGNKRAYAETRWEFPSNDTESSASGKELPAKTGQNQSNVVSSNNTNNAKAQVVGWPPIRSFRKNTLASSSKNADEVDGKPGFSSPFVKVSMDGAPYLRKVDLRIYSTYIELFSALEKMFSCFSIGQCGRGTLNETKLRDILCGSEYVLTFEDRDGDWMLVGDVPWEMFVDSCKKLKIMKSTDAIGLAPRAMEKSKDRT